MNAVPTALLSKNDILGKASKSVLSIGENGLSRKSNVAGPGKGASKYRPYDSGAARATMVDNPADQD